MSVDRLGPLMIDFRGEMPDASELERLRHPSTGGLIIFARNYSGLEQICELVRAAREARPDILIAVDYEGGRVQRFGAPFVQLPPMRRLGEIWDEDSDRARRLAGQHGWMIGAELRACDIDLAFAPVLDIDHGCCAVIGDRALHGDPAVVTQLAIAHMRGMHSAGMAATGKHYPGHGHVAEDSHHELPVDHRSEAELQADEQPFADLMAAGLDSIMMAHIVYPAVDDAPASLSSRWIRDRLRGALRFDGPVFCDDLSMGGAASVGDYAERARRAMQAGCDMLPVCNNTAEAERLAGQITDQRDPAADKRLVRLRSKSAPDPCMADWRALHDSAQWTQASEELAEVLASATG